MTPMVPPNRKTPDPELIEFYENEARKYLRSLPLEHFMEATGHAHQRKITLESFDVIRRARPDIQCFNELLIQYDRPNLKFPSKIVPDNFVVVHPEPIDGLTSFVLAVQPAAPLLVLEYVSKQSQRKDYEANFERYEKELRVPYYLLFYPDNEELTVFRLTGERYAATPPNHAGRYPVPELELEAALLDGWVRFWFRGELVPLPADLLDQLDAVRQQLSAERQARLAAEQRADAAEQRAHTADAEIARLREELARAKGLANPPGG